MIRAVMRRDARGVEVEETLEASDRRTVARLLSLGWGKKKGGSSGPKDLEDLFERQRWVTNNAAMRELRRAIALKVGPFSGDGAAEMNGAGAASP